MRDCVAAIAFVLSALVLGSAPELAAWASSGSPALGRIRRPG